MASNPHLRVTRFHSTVKRTVSLLRSLKPASILLARLSQRQAQHSRGCATEFRGEYYESAWRRNPGLTGITRTKMVLRPLGAFLTGSPIGHRRQAAASKPISAPLSRLAKPAKGPLVPLQHAVPITMVGAITERVLTYSRSLHEKSDLVLVGHADAAMHLNALTRHQIVSVV